VVSTRVPISEEEKRQALETVLASTSFARSAQLRALLRYLCEHEWSGQTEALTEYQIAVEVLGRRKDIDPSDDASVRNRAYELRQRLDRCYTLEHPDAELRIEIPRGGYIPVYTRRPLPVPPASAATPEIVQAAVPVAHEKPRRRWRWVALPIACLGLGIAAGLVIAPSPRPAPVVKEAWGPLADSSSDMLIVIATNMHLIVRPHMPPYPQRLDAPQMLYPLYGPNRPLAPNAKLYMEPAQLSIPMGELSAAASLSNVRTSFGGAYQMLPEAEAPAAALRGRNAFIIGSGTNSQTATTLLEKLPYTIDYTPDDRFAVIDRSKPAGQNYPFVSQPTGQPVRNIHYGLISVITDADTYGRPRRIVVISGSASAGVQGAVEYFCSAVHLRELKNRFAAAGLKTFPGTYQVVVRCIGSGVRLLSYEYAAHAVPRP
jgi:hypothetical protein